MKFWILTTEFPPFSGGGISTYCDHTARMLAEQGHEVTVILPTSKGKKVQRDEIAHRIRTISFPVPKQAFLGDKASLSYGFANILEDLQKEEGCPDFIEAQDYDGIAYYPLQKKLLTEGYLDRAVFYLTLHAPGFLYQEFNQIPRYRLPDYWTGEMEKAAIKSADLVISPSAFLVEQLSSRLDLSDQKVFVIPNPYQIPVENQLTGEKEEVLFFGKLTPQKGCLELLEYFVELWDDGLTIPLKFIGGGEHYFYPKMMDMGSYLTGKYKAYLKKGLLTFEGHLDPSQLDARLRNAKAIVIPSIVDNLPYTVLEAMSMGQIVLASTSGGQKEVIQDEVNGFLFDHEVEGNFSQKLKKILSLKSEEVAVIGKAARKRVEELCNYQNIYKEKLELLSTPENGKVSDFPFIRPSQISGDEKRIQLDKNDLLSIVIPYYNMGEFLENALCSVENSDYPEKEVVVIDDGSTDPLSIEKLVELSSKFDFKLISQKNRGLAATRNTGAKEVKGQFLAFLDPDDTVESSYYSKAIRNLKKYENLSFVGCWARYFGEKDEIWPAFNPELPYYLINNSINSSALVYKTSAFLDAGWNDSRMIYGMEDYESTISLLKKGYRGAVLPEVLWNYRIRSDSMAGTFNPFSKLYLHQVIASKHADSYNHFGAEIASLLNANGSGLKFYNPSQSIVDLEGIILTQLKDRLLKPIKANKRLSKVARKIYHTIIKTYGNRNH